MNLIYLKICYKRLFLKKLLKSEEKISSSKTIWDAYVLITVESSKDICLKEAERLTLDLQNYLSSWYK